MSKLLERRPLLDVEFDRRMQRGGINSSFRCGVKVPARCGERVDETVAIPADHGFELTAREPRASALEPSRCA